MKPEVPFWQAPRCSLEQEKNPWLAAEARFDEAATRLNLGRRSAQSPAHLRQGNHRPHIPIQLDDGRLEVFTGYRVFGGVPQQNLICYLKFPR
jgi:glutamate dehydrogenase (NAD(P)+)